MDASLSVSVRRSVCSEEGDTLGNEREDELSSEMRAERLHGMNIMPVMKREISSPSAEMDTSVTCGMKKVEENSVKTPDDVQLSV